MSAPSAAILHQYERHDRRKKNWIEPAVLWPLVISVAIELALGLMAYGALKQEVLDVHETLNKLELRLDSLIQSSSRREFNKSMVTIPER